MPALCAQLLAQRLVDVALVPVIEYQRLDDVSIVEDVCVGSKEEVRSVVLVSKIDELGNIKSVALDQSSRTSAALVQIIFREFLGKEPEWSNHAPNIDEMLATNDAALIIGDPAMAFRKDEFAIWDLASVWRQNTGLGFVFAMWLIANESSDVVNQIDFRSARDEGVEHIPDIVTEFANKIPLGREELHHYLSENISYKVEESMRQGLQLYYELAAKHHLIEKVKPLSFQRAV